MHCYYDDRHPYIHIVICVAFSVSKTSRSYFIFYQLKCFLCFFFLYHQTNENDLRKFFSQYGSVKEVKIVNDRAGVSKGLVSLQVVHRISDCFYWIATFCILPLVPFFFFFQKEVVVGLAVLLFFFGGGPLVVFEIFFGFNWFFIFVLELSLVAASRASRVHRLQQLWCMGLVASPHVESSPTRDGTNVP